MKLFENIYRSVTSTISDDRDKDFSFLVTVRRIDSTSN